MRGGAPCKASHVTEITMANSFDDNSHSKTSFKPRDVKVKCYRCLGMGKARQAANLVFIEGYVCGQGLCRRSKQLS